MSPVVIFVFGGGVMGIALASAFIGLMASDTPSEPVPVPLPNRKSTNSRAVD